jgi:menaquinol-cytochrome c reductase iron-sulfur subunit
MAEPPDRRDVLKLAACAIGGGVGVAVLAPAVRLVLDPAGKQTVKTPTDPLQIGDVEQFKIGAAPSRVDIVAPIVQDAWTGARDVVLGSAWIRRVSADKIEALSAVCPHLGCVVGWDPAQNNFLCPCHDSRFAANGDRMTGPSERALDPLPVSVKDGKLSITWVRYRMGGSKPESM